MEDWTSRRVGGTTRSRVTGDSAPEVPGGPGRVRSENVPGLDECQRVCALNPRSIYLSLFSLTLSCSVVWLEVCLYAMVVWTSARIVLRGSMREGAMVVFMSSAKLADWRSSTVFCGPSSQAHQVREPSAGSASITRRRGLGVHGSTAGRGRAKHRKSTFLAWRKSWKQKERTSSCTGCWDTHLESRKNTPVDSVAEKSPCSACDRSKRQAPRPVVLGRHPADRPI